MSAAPQSGYKFGNKNQWRRWVWNRISERLSVPAKGAIVLYLAGPDDLDRQEAIRRGFRPTNLIAVDVCGDAIKAVRRRKGIGINASLHRLLTAWPESRRVDVVFADFCSGFDARAMDFVLQLTFLSQLVDSVIALNLMRGRDGTGNDSRAVTARLFKNHAEKHRGRHAYLTYSMHNYFLRMSKYVGLDEWCRVIIDEDRQIDDTEMVDDLRVMGDAQSVCFNSYRSTSGQTFDSVIFANRYPTVFNARETLKPFSNHLRSAVKQADMLTCRKISAALAVRSMRAGA